MRPAYHRLDGVLFRTQETNGNWSAWRISEDPNARTEWLTAKNGRLRSFRSHAACCKAACKEWAPKPTAEVLNLIWRHTHPDYRGITDGVRYVLTYSPQYGTISTPLDNLPLEELVERYLYAKRREARGERPY